MMKKLCKTLSQTPLLRGLNHDLFHEYCAQTNIRLVWKGEILFNEGDACTGIGVVIEGQLAMQKYSSTGEYSTLALLGPDNVFGEYLIFGKQNKFPFTIEAVSHSKVIMIPHDILVALLYKSPEIMKSYLAILSDRIQAQNRRISLLAQKSLRQKIAHYLLDLLREQCEAEDETGNTGKKVSTEAVELPVSKEVVSRLLAMPRPSLSRELISMEKDGLIRVSGRVIWLTDLDRLENTVVEGVQI
jgi:CRP-like cAMP-binding protein